MPIMRVLERHKDFDREFRGEFAQPSLLEALDQLGIVSELRKSGGSCPSGRCACTPAGRLSQ